MEFPDWVQVKEKTLYATLMLRGLYTGKINFGNFVDFRNILDYLSTSNLYDSHKATTE